MGLRLHQRSILADLKIHGRVQPVILHAPKDGFFYVLDRATGKLLSAKNYVPNTWASHIDLKTGRPAIYPDAFVAEKPHLLTPGYGGGHNWNPMSYSPLTGLVYIPAQVQWMVESRLPEGRFKFVLGQSTAGGGVNNYPELRKQLNARASHEKGYLLAWDPVHQREAFRVSYPHPGNGGTLATAGNLLVQGTINKTLAIYRADNGRKLWEMPVQTVPVAAPMAFAVDGRQYIAVNAGWNSAIVQGLNTAKSPFSVSEARLLVFALDGSDQLPPPPDPAPSTATATAAAAAAVQAGAALYSMHCATCHGQNAAGGAKDLRFMSAQKHGQFFDIVLDGTLKKGGMESFPDRFTHEQAADIHAYLISRAQDDWQPDFTRPRRK